VKCRKRPGTWNGRNFHLARRPVMSNMNTLELSTLDDEDLMDIVGGCGESRSCYTPPCERRQECYRPPCEVAVVLVLPLC
jgi:hypothetical protein